VRSGAASSSPDPSSYLHTYLLRARRDLDAVESRRFGRRRVQVPAIEARYAGCFVGGRDWVLVEGGVGGVLKHCGIDALVVVDCAVADELHLRNARDGLEV
jgi:hypothetical protein